MSDNAAKDKSGEPNKPDELPKARFTRVEIPPALFTGVSLGVPSSSEGKVGSFFVVTFFFAPPEDENKTHAIMGRYIFPWDEGQKFAKNLLEFIEKNQPSDKK